MNDNSNTCIVEVKNIQKTYPSFKLKNVSFNIEKGHITGFVGRNGAGKTTTIKSMLNLIHPDAGDVFYFGKSLNGNETEIKRDKTETQKRRSKSAEAQTRGAC